MADNALSEEWQTTPLGSDSAAYLEVLYERYLRDKNAVEDKWRVYFDALPRASSDGASESLHTEVQARFLNLVRNNGKAVASTASAGDAGDQQQVRVQRFIEAYRARGHQHATLDPLSLQPRPEIPDLSLAYHGLSEADLSTVFDAGSLFNGERVPLRAICDALQKTYCTTVGAEYSHITCSEEKLWLQQRLEANRAHPEFAPAAKMRILEKLTAAEGLERYLHSKYVGQKRFSLEGGDSLNPLLDEIIQRSGTLGAKEIVISMAHRGRLNVLVNVLGKSPKELFEEFEGKYNSDDIGTGDVKYHLGFSSDLKTPKGSVHLALAFNPSHLEIACPVAEGSVRARQERRRDRAHNQVIPVSIHGDAAFAGQGVVMETFNMSQARGFRVGGTLHVVINNQIGFTTSNPLDTRSTLYCTDVAKMVQAPIFHVNADDPEAVIFITQLALDYRMQFNKDVVIDMVCYRRHGHNEADEPSATQPLMYQVIRQHPTTRQLYAERLQKEGVIDASAAQKLVDDYRVLLDAGECVVDDMLFDEKPDHLVDWSPYDNPNDWDVPADTKLPMETLQSLAGSLAHFPEGFKRQAQVNNIYKNRAKMTAGDIPLDWGYAETMAYAAILNQGYAIRLTGQDSGRGTFAHRHSVLHHQETGETYIPLQNLGPDQPRYLVIDSLLSEEAVLAYEYGYSLSDPETLVIWEAQFGDFANGAQVVIDQFISSGELKWGRLSGLTMFLPHGYEGMGPEHSSARLERYLQLCAQHNIQVCVPSTPSQVFHMLCRQMFRSFRRPLIVMTPKSLLRHKLAVSSLENLTDGCFYRVAPEIDPIDPAAVKRVILCSGKVFYDLLERRREEKRHDIAILRIEQLYPFPERDLCDQLARYGAAKEVVWCQEEPLNQGAWYCTQHRLRACLLAHQTLSIVAREASAAPSVGYMSVHKEQQEALVDEAITTSGS